MPSEWATSGLDMHLDPDGSRLRAGLEQALRDAVQSGRLRPGARLPSSRALALDLGVARNTVANAYGQLVAEGWLTARQGSGTRVADAAATVSPQPAASPPAPRRVRYDLRPGSPDLAAFPRPAWIAAGRRALNAAPTEALGYSGPSGRTELRRPLADHLARTRGVRVTGERLVVCSGFAQGFGLLCRVLRARGARTLAVEEYCLPIHRDIAAAHGLSLRILPVDGDGADTTSLDGADAVLLTPAHQFPLGVTLAAGRRRAAVEWAVATGGLVIEDDYDGEFRYDRQPVGAMQALAPEHVAYAGTASKTLAPGLRLGWLALPEHLQSDVVAAKAVTDPQTGVLDQLTLAEFIVTGAYDRHIRRSRLTYRRRRDRLAATLARRVPRARITGIAAGLHALVELPPGQAEHAVVARAGRSGLAVEGLGAYAAGPEQHHGAALVVGYATPPAHAFTATVARLCAVLS
jgi:GntR family transcriptional regulator / MocR family aminotransferase